MGVKCNENIIDTQVLSIMSIKTSYQMDWQEFDMTIV